jgi:hypothetical protein
VIDVYTADYFIPISQPLVIHFRNEPDKFIDTLTHELTHVLLTDNQHYQIATSEFDLRSAWENLFGEHDFSTLVHIPVHAVMKYIYLDVLDQPYRLDRDLEFAQSLNRTTAYKDSWQYVNENDYIEILSQVKQIFREIE